MPLRSILRTFELESIHYKRALAWLAAGAVFGVSPPAAYGHGFDMSSCVDDYAYNLYASFFISSYGSNQLMKYGEATGTYLGVIFNLAAPVASQIGLGADLYVSASGAGEVLRFDGYSGTYKGVFISPGEGGLTTPTAPNFGPDNLVYVGDASSNQLLRFDATGHFIEVFADQASSGLTSPYMETFDDETIFLASGGTNSVLRWELKTKKFLGAFVAPNSGGLTRPVGLEIGPDGNLYVSSSTNAVLRYDGKTGAFQDAFGPPGLGGLSDPHAIRFGGPNSNLFVVSTGRNQVLEFDRLTGAFVRVLADGNQDGLTAARGLTFTPRPIFNVYATIKIDSVKTHKHHHFEHVTVEKRLKDYSDPSPQVALASIVSSDTSVDVRQAVRGAQLGSADFDFDLDLRNSTGVEQRYTVTYRATNSHRLTTTSTTQVVVPPG